MFVFGELFRALALLVDGVSQIIYWLLFARIVISWFPIDPYHSIVQFLYQATEPIMQPFRKIPLQIGMMDFTPLVTFIALFFIRNVLVRVLLGLAQQFGTAGAY